MNNAVPETTYLTLSDRLPLTCTRLGTCCHGKMVWLNPWELACLAAEKGVSSQVFRDRYCEFGGIRLRFDGAPGWKKMAACSQYLPGRGCSIHAGRPLSCRLFPLGRQRSGSTLQYIHRGSAFPCMEGCPNVAGLPYLSVADYISGQDVLAGETAQDAYLELMQQLADGAFALLLESGLAATGDRVALREWRTLGNHTPDQLAQRIGPQWIDRLMLPHLPDALDNPTAFSRQHHDLLQTQAQTLFGNPSGIGALRKASGLMMGLALYLGRGLGATPAELAEHWIATAKEHGARD